MTPSDRIDALLKEEITEHDRLFLIDLKEYYLAYGSLTPKQEFWLGHHERRHQGKQAKVITTEDSTNGELI